MKKAKKAAKRTTTKRSSGAALAKKIAEKARPHMRVVDVMPAADETMPSADAHVAEEIPNERTVRRATKAPKNSTEELHMVTMEPKVSSDQGPRRRTVIVDSAKKKIVGEAG